MGEQGVLEDVPVTGGRREVKGEKGVTGGVPVTGGRREVNG